MADPQLLGALRATLSPDTATRNAAEAALDAASQQNWPQFIATLCTTLVDNSQDDGVRQQAGTQLKNNLSSKNEEKQKMFADRWNQQIDQFRASVKSAVMTALGSPSAMCRSAAASAVSAIALLEVPAGRWNELMTQLLENIRAGDPNLRAASFSALGFVCEAVPEYMQPQSFNVLNAIAQGMKKEEKDPRIKLNATKALQNSLKFVQENFKRDQDRGAIMAMVFQAVQSEDAAVRSAAFQCLCSIAELYYDFLEPHIIDIFQATAATIVSTVQHKEDPDVGLQAIEFWNVICDEEIEIQVVTREEQEAEMQASRVLRGYAKRAQQALVPVLLNCLTQQEEDQDEDTRNMSSQAGTCLGLLAQNVKDEIIPHVLQFVQTNLPQADWRLKEAGCLAFASMLDGPAPETLRSLVLTAFPLILAQLSDPVRLVKDTAAWATGKICEVVPDVINMDPKLLPLLISSLVKGLADQPKIAANICWAISSLAEAVDVDPENPSTSALSPYFRDLMSALISASSRNTADVAHSNLIPSAYHAMNTLIESAAEDVAKMISDLIPGLMGRLNETFSLPKETQLIAQSNVCSVITASLRKLQLVNPDLIKSFAQPLMKLLIAVLQSRNATVHEEAMMAIGFVCDTLKEEFKPYMNDFFPLLLTGLQNWQETAACILSITVLGDVFRAMKRDLQGPAADQLATILLTLLQSKQVHRDVKPHVISALGDMASALGGLNFSRYMDSLMPMLADAAAFQFASVDAELEEYLNTLRFSLLETFSAIIAALADEHKEEMFLPWVDCVLLLCSLVWNDKHRSDNVLQQAVGLLGDIADLLKAPVKEKLRVSYVSALINAAIESAESPDIKKVGLWTASIMHALMSSR